MYIFEYEKSELNMFVAGELIQGKKGQMPKVRGVFYDDEEGLDSGEIGYPLSGDEEKYETPEAMMRKVIPYIFEGWK